MNEVLGFGLAEGDGEPQSVPELYPVHRFSAVLCVMDIRQKSSTIVEATRVRHAQKQDNEKKIWKPDVNAGIICKWKATRSCHVQLLFR